MASSQYLTSLNVPCISTKVIVAPGTISSFILDTADFKVAQFYVIVSCLEDNFVATITLDESQDSTFSTFNSVGLNFLSFTENSNNLIINETNSLVVKSIGYVGKKRYVRININISEVNSSYLSVMCVLTDPLHIPININVGIAPPPILTEYRVINTGDFRVCAVNVSNGQRVVQIV